MHEREGNNPQKEHPKEGKLKRAKSFIVRHQSGIIAAPTGIYASEQFATGHPIMGTVNAGMSLFLLGAEAAKIATNKAANA